MEISRSKRGNSLTKARWHKEPVILASQKIAVADKSLLAFSLLISEDFWHFLIFPTIALISAHLSEGTKTQRSPRKERETQKSLLVSKEKVDKDRCVFKSRNAKSQVFRKKSQKNHRRSKSLKNSGIKNFGAWNKNAAFSRL